MASSLGGLTEFPSQRTTMFQKVVDDFLGTTTCEASAISDFRRVIERMGPLGRSVARLNALSRTTQSARRFRRRGLSATARES